MGADLCNMSAILDRDLQLIEQLRAENKRLKYENTALHNRLVSAFTDAQTEGVYETRIAKAEAQANEFVDAFRRVMGYIDKGGKA